MRIVGGKFRGKRLKPPTRLRARPTTDFAKEGLFNVLHHSIALEGISVLDLFAGTGAISLEFLSRGAENVTSVDGDRQAVRYMQGMAQDFPDVDWNTIYADVFAFLRTYGGKHDVVFADPPFNSGQHEKVIEHVLEKEILNNDGLLIVEHPPQVTLTHMPFYLNTRKYGNLEFSFFKPTADV